LVISKIFISYRRDDARAYAGWLHNALKNELGSRTLFLDIKNVPPGILWGDYLNRQLSACDIFLAVIGPNWLDAKDERGNRRLDDPEDHVAGEIEAALKRRDIPVVPILVDGAPLPTKQQLPERLKDLVDRESVEVRYRQFDRDVQEFAHAIRGAMREKQAWPVRWSLAAVDYLRRKGAVATAGAVAGLILGLTIFYLLSPRFDAVVDRQAKLPDVAEAKTAEQPGKAAAEKAAAEKAAAEKAAAEKAAAEKAAAEKAAAEKAAAEKAAAEKAATEKAAAEKVAAEKAAAERAAAERAAAERAAAQKAAAEKAAAEKAAAEKAAAEKAAAEKAAAEKVAALNALKVAPREPAAALACDERQVIAWLDQHGAYNGRLDPSIYDDQVQWIVSGKRSTKTRSEIAKDEEGFRKKYPVQKYTAQTSSTAMDGRHCVLTQQLDSYKRRPNGTEERGTFRVVRTIRTDVEGPRIVAHQIDVLSRR
jgi:chemotaxis protein histidine kinase CheA